MVEFEHQPWEKIIVHEVVKYPLDHFIIKHSMGAEGGIGAPLNWANGVVFEHGPVRPTDDVITEQLKGVIHWSFLHYGLMPEYKKEVEAPRKVKVPVIDSSSHHIFSGMSKWLLENFETSARS